ncbi:hypothetical protein CK203_092304 [Vitis vinifera]|uniref:Uncharacterized protein n=1 Tax=Vitis vinifera TaxID=29760 RepID=A0A438FKV7_VITVI|nr:hypothetical protein CK203_092304 [Vitis vinifera]
MRRGGSCPLRRLMQEGGVRRIIVSGSSWKKPLRKRATLTRSSFLEKPAATTPFQKDQQPPCLHLFFPNPKMTGPLCQLSHLKPGLPLSSQCVIPFCFIPTQLLTALFLRLYAQVKNILGLVVG